MESPYRTTTAGATAIHAPKPRSGERAIVQTTKIGADARELFKKLKISAPKPILASD